MVIFLFVEGSASDRTSADYYRSILIYGRGQLGLEYPRYSAVLGNLRDNYYLSQKDVNTLLADSLENKSIYLKNISIEKAEIVRKALRENFNKKFK